MYGREQKLQYLGPWIFFCIKNCKNEINNTNIKIFTYKAQYINIKYIKIMKNTNFFCIQNKCTCAYGIKCL